MKLAIESEREVTITRTFAAPRGRVFQAMTTPELLRRWYGMAIMTLVVCEVELRVGGAWRYVLRAPDGVEHGFTGVYRVVEPEERVVCTERYEALGPGHEMIVTMTYTERAGQTTLAIALVYPSQADRDAHLGSGMEPGMRASFDRLEALLSTAVDTGAVYRA